MILIWIFRMVLDSMLEGRTVVSLVTMAMIETPPVAAAMLLLVQIRPLQQQLPRFQSLPQTLQTSEFGR